MKVTSFSKEKLTFLSMAKYKTFPEDKGKPRSIPVDRYPELGDVKQPEELDQFADSNTTIWVVPASSSSKRNTHSKKDTGSPPVIFEIRNSNMPSGAQVIFSYDPFTSKIGDIKCAISGLQSIDCKMQVNSLNEIRQFMSLPHKEAAEFVKTHLKFPSPETAHGVSICQMLDDIIKRG